MMNEKLAPAINAYLAGIQIIHDTHLDTHGLRCPGNEVHYTAEPGKRYIRIVANGNQRMVHSFIDATNGDVLKPAGWKAPAKHARGNIYDEHGGLKTMGPHGPAYLR